MTELRDIYSGQIYSPIQLLHIQGKVIDIRLTNWSESVIFDGETYTAYPFEVSPLKTTSSGTLPGVDITTPVIDGYMLGLLEVYDSFIDCPIQIITVFAEYLDDPSLKIVQVYTIEEVNAKVDDELEMQCVPLLFSNCLVPRRGMFRGTCQWRYRGEGCWLWNATTESWEAPAGFVNEGIWCTKTIEACRLHGNYARFSGAPAIPWTHPYMT